MAQNQIVIYQIEDGRTQIDVRLENETVWLTQAQMAELFQKTPQNITMHIQNAYREGELDKSATCKEFLQVQKKGNRTVKRVQKFYDLDVIISVGYRVKSKRGTAFRIWARKVLNEEIQEALKFLKGIEDDVKTEREKLLDFIREFAKRYKEEKHKLPYHLNVIDELHINENAHSRILMKLLCYQNDKGEYEILQSLLEYMKSKKEAFSSISIENPTITQEEQRIDLWIRDKDYAIIFENKIYNAKDQKEQIRRYIDKTKDEKYKVKEIIYVIYLSQDGKEPDDQAWGDYKDTFKDRYLNLSFRYDILRWLRERVLPNVRHKDDYLKCALKQYIDYLEGLFELRTIQKPMIMTLKEIIQKKLELENKKPQDCFFSITEEIESCNKLLESLNSLREEYRHDCWKEGTKNKYPNYKPNEAGFFTDVTLNQKDGKELLVIVSDDNDNKGVYCQVEYRDKSIIDGTLIEKLNSFLDETNAKWREENNSTQIWKYFKNDPKGAYEKFNEVVDYLIKELENR